MGWGVCSFCKAGQAPNHSCFLQLDELKKWRVHFCEIHTELLMLVRCPQRMEVLTVGLNPTKSVGSVDTENQTTAMDKDFV